MQASTRMWPGAPSTRRSRRRGRGGAAAPPADAGAVAAPASPSSAPRRTERTNATSMRCGSTFRPSRREPGQHPRRDHGLARQEAIDGGACDGLGRQAGEQPRALLVGLHVVGEEPRVDGARQQHRHRHAGAGQLACHRPARGDEVGLGGTVEREVRHRQHAGERGDVEHAAASTRHHAGQAGVHEGRRRVHIEAQRGAHPRLVVAGEGARRADARAVDQDIDAASRVGDRGHQVGDGMWLGQIAGDVVG